MKSENHSPGRPDQRTRAIRSSILLLRSRISALEVSCAERAGGPFLKLDPRFQNLLRRMNFPPQKNSRQKAVGRRRQKAVTSDEQL